MKKEWFAVRTKPHKEFVAQQNFVRQNFTVYLPQIMKTRSHARRMEKVRRPFFPGYLFLHLAPEERVWPTIASTRGVLAPVQFGGCFPPVPDEIILSLQAQEDEKGYMNNSLANGWMTPGLKVRIKHGNLDDIEGIFQQVTGENRALVLVEILRRQVVTAVPISSLIAA